MAAAVLITAPMLIVFVVGQKKFIAGIAISGLKA
jgi:ABC-type glycerol-3-phosphate transport system permease component